MRARGFPWFEVVLSLVCATLLLAIVLQGAAQRNTERYRRGGGCVSQLKQIALATLQYTADYDERFPLSTVAATWRGRQRDYMKNTVIYACPLDRSVATLLGVGVDASGFGSSYMANLALCGETSTAQAAVDAPGRTVLQVEYDQGPEKVRLAPYRYTHAVALGAGPTARFLAGTLVAAEALRTERGGPNCPRHDGRLNCSFVDGHIQQLKPLALANRGVPNADGLFNATDLR